MKSNTYSTLVEKFGGVNIPLAIISKEIFGLGCKKANEYACAQRLPVPTYKLGSKRSPWMMDAEKLAAYIDNKKAIAESEWKSVQAN